MTQYYWLGGQDPELDMWLLYEDGPGGVLQVRPQYADLRCPSCGKVDEFKALARGVSAHRPVRSRRDWARTHDDQLCVSRRCADLVCAHKVQGVAFVPIEGTSFSVLVPTMVAPVDEDRCAMERVGKCDVCGRYRCTVGLPPQAALTFPRITNCIFRPGVAFESIRGMGMWVLADQQVVDLMKRQGIKGIEYYLGDAILM